MTTPFDPSAYGLDVSGGSSVSVPGFTSGGIAPGAKVYMGANNKFVPGVPGVVPFSSTFDVTGQRYTSSDTLSYEKASSLPGTWSEKQKRDFISRGILYKMPNFNADMGMPEIMQAWGNLVDDSVKLSATGKNWSPNDVMESYANQDKNFGTIKSADGDWLLDAATGQKIKYIGPRTKTTTEKRVDLSSPEDVRALTTQMLTELLGRAPSADELSKYRGAINGYENANPELTTTTNTLNDQGEVESSSSTTSGGASDAARSMLITDQAKKGPEYGKFQSSTTYYNALMQMVGGG